ncbi:response regulator transcription factor [Nocardia alni]|uniref:response regulator transcription factor n=1 Tax=Nocardia alni TaxID=2815723 RepID=UPI001C221AAE|nr:response regulator transcription factor [Nocardia alni]
MVKVCIVDDHEVVREGLRAILCAFENPHVEIVGEVGTGADSLKVQSLERPELFLVDYRLPDMSGDRLCKALLQARPDTAVVVVSSSNAEDVIHRCLRAGAAGYATKGAGLKELRGLLTAVLAGQVGVVRRDLMPGTSEHSRPIQGGRALTQHQIRVLELVAEGLTYGQIARRLHISESTVRFHVNGIKERVGVRTTPELIVTALREGLIDPEVATAGETTCLR